MKFNLLTFPAQPSHDQVSFSIEMRELSNSGGSRMIDAFTVMSNSSCSESSLYLDGEFGLAKIMLNYQLECFNLSVCGTTPSITCENGMYTFCKVYSTNLFIAICFLPLA